MKEHIVYVYFKMYLHKLTIYIIHNYINIILLFIAHNNSGSSSSSSSSSNNNNNNNNNNDTWGWVTNVYTFTL